MSWRSLFAPCACVFLMAAGCSELDGDLDAAAGPRQTQARGPIAPPPAPKPRVDPDAQLGAFVAPPSTVDAGEGEGADDPAGAANHTEAGISQANAAPADTLFGKAKQAFAAGRAAAGAQFMQAAAIAGEPEINLAEAMGWCPGLKRPAMTVSWAIGWQTVDSKGERVVEDGGAEAGAPGAANPAMLLEDFRAHTFGTADGLLDTLAAHAASGAFGTVIRQAAEEVGPAANVAATLLGSDEAENLFTRAKEAGCDLLLTVVYRQRPPRAGSTTPQTVMVLEATDVMTGRPVDSSSPIGLAGSVVDKAEQEGKGEEPRAELLDKFKQYVDEKFTIGRLPNLPEGTVKGRIESLVGGTHELPLAPLAEIKLYEALGITTLDETAAAYERMHGDAGLQLATGTMEARREVLQRWLPEAE